jgi:hypothetical protein
MHVPRPYNRPQSLVRMPGDRVVLRLVTPDGVRMATTLRPMTLRDVFTRPRFRRPS